MKTIIIKVIASVVITFFMRSPLAEMVWNEYKSEPGFSSDMPGGFIVITCLLAFLWCYFFISCTALALRGGMLPAFIVGIFSIALGGAFAIGDTFTAADLYFGKGTFETIVTTPDIWIVLLISLVLFIVFPIIDTIIAIIKIREGE